MVLYSYSAKNAKGERVQGTIDAADVTAARIALAEQALLPEEVFQISYDTKSSTDFASLPSKPVSSPPVPVPAAAPSVPAAPPHKPLSIPEPSTQAPAHDWTAEQAATEQRQYFPFLDTLRLYAGWLLAWYAIVYGLGAFTTTRSLPFEVPYLIGIYASPLVLSFTLASFLFLMMTSAYKAMGKSTLSALLCTIVGVLAFVFYRVNV